jgi:periplasmic protein TonB
MVDQKTGVPKTSQHLLPGASSTNSPRQQRLMLAALGLLLVSLTFVLYRDRDFWFPDTQDAETRPLSPSVAQESVPTAAVAPPAVAPASRKKPPVREAVKKDSQNSNESSNPGPGVTTTRSVLPPLEVEVVAGDAHRTVRAGSNAVHVDLERAPSRQDLASVTSNVNQPASRVATPAAERTSVSPDAASSMVIRSVQPEYPMLARQMRVQGSVILQALIGRDGMIQDLRVLSGPPILASAAQEAVRQWHFKPHYVGAQPVETRASITVNFMISTN